MNAIIHPQVKQRGGILDSFKHNYLVSTLMISFLWFINGNTYYGALFLVTQLGKSCSRLPSDSSVQTNYSTFFGDNTTSNGDNNFAHFGNSSYYGALVLVGGTTPVVPPGAQCIGLYFWQISKRHRHDHSANLIEILMLSG